MKTTALRTALGLTLLGLSIGGTTGWASDWPCWRGPRGDGISRETGLAHSWPEGGPKKLWSTPLGSGFSSVSVAGGKAYTMYATEAGEMVACISMADGKFIWQTRSGNMLENEYGNGPRATPTVTDGRVFTHGGTGQLLCLDAATGKKIWGFNTLDKFGDKNLDFGLSASPVVVDNMLVVVVGGKGDQTLAALDKTTGDVLWAGLKGKGGYSTPFPIEVGGLRQLAILTGQAIVGVTLKEGRELWRDPWKTSLDANVATPIFHDDRLFVASGYGTGCALFQLTATAGTTQAKKLWASKNMKNYFSTCVLLDGYLYGFNNTILTCMEFATGKVRWRQRGFNRGSLVAADGMLFILGERGTLALAKVTPDAYEELGRVEKVLEPKTWTVPTIADGRLLVRNEKELICLDIRGEPR